MESFGLADVVAATREQSKSAADAAAPGPADAQEMSAIASCWRYTSYFWSTAVLIFAIVVLYWDVSTVQLLLRPWSVSPCVSPPPFPHPLFLLVWKVLTADRGTFTA